VHRRIDQSARRFLQREIGSLGSVTLDPDVARSTNLALPVMLGVPECAAAQSIEAIAATLAGVVGWRLQRQIVAAEERQRRSDLENQAVLDDTARQSEAARLAAAKELEATRAMANRAQRMADVLAAPDLLRFSLSGADGASGQAMVSRSRGFVVRGSLLPSPPANGSYQAWLLTRTTAVKVGPLAAEPDGTFTLAQPMPAVPRAIVGVMVTEEPVNGGDAPSRTTILTSVRSAQSVAEAAPP
jgi:hypothetical protein